MHLKSLELHGFKSFAEKTVLAFPPPAGDRQSITAIVGPNGSGKSNVADAIRWVMGEQSMKTLRGKKSQEIIFSGSSGKGKMGAASVTMVLDNRNHRMPLAYEDVVISRRIDQTGESEYVVNGNPVRLFDLQILLAQAQFGHGSYSIIGQGTIDRLLSQSSAERKDFFDEACGIKEFQIKRHQAALKLERTKAHVAEAGLLLGEIAPRLKHLARQMKKLEEREAIVLRLRELQERYYVTVWQREEKIRSLRKQESAVIEADIARLQGDMARVEIEIDALAQRTVAESDFQTLQQLYEQLVEERSHVIREQTLIAARLAQEYRSEGDKETGWMLAKRDALKAERLALQETQERSGKEARELQAALQAFEQELQELLGRRKAVAANLESLEAEFAQMKEEARQLPRFEASALKTVLAAPDMFGRVYGTVATLARPRNSASVLALDIAAGHHLTSIVTEDDRVAERWIEYLRSQKLGVATFLPKNTVKPRSLPHDSETILKSPGVVGLATDLVQYDAQFSGIFSFVFGTTLIVESIEHARRIGIGRIRMVTLTGDVLETGGSMKGGFRGRNAERASFGASGMWQEEERIARQGKAILDLKAELRAIEERREGVESRARAARERFAVAEQRVALQREHIEALLQEEQSLDDEYRLTSGDPKSVKQALAEIRERHDAIGIRLREIDAKMKETQAAIARVRREEDERASRMFALQTQLREFQTSLNALSGQSNQKQVEIARLETKQEDIDRETVQELRVSVSALVERGIVGEEGAADAFSAEIQKLKYALTLIGGIDEDVMKEYTETKERHDGLARELDDLARATADLETLIAELDDIMKKKRSETFRAIRKEFIRYFSVLFGGGKADLVEMYGNSEKEGEEGVAAEAEATVTHRGAKTVTGIDVVAHPPGKKIVHIQALSGGERTIVSLALISAILRINPAPFVVLDEVEAALDEANTVRFGTILQELSGLSQFILITHNRATMHIADTLYGVTMGGEGVSRLVSVKLPAA